MSELKTGVLLQGGKYRIEKSLGQGGFGITYLAEQTNLGRKVCIKEFFMKEYGERTAAPAADDTATVIADDSTVLTGVSAVTSAAAEIMGKYREKFVKEARTIARLDHPGIVRIHDVFEENGTAYYVMDFIEGENLNDLVKREGALSEERALCYIRQVADALSYVHGHNITHHDVKPANIIVRKSDDKAILIDFGTAKQYDSEGSQTSTTPVGLSVGYAPIEMTRPGGGQTFSPETDVYSLGATLYYLVTGQNPPDASERIEMIEEGETLCFPEPVSNAVSDTIDKSMRTRKKRIQTMALFLESLPSLSNAAQEETRTLFCSKCGRELAPNTRFCPNCGRAVVLKEASHEHIVIQDEKQEVDKAIGTGLENGHEWVDLGLPSGILWATCNVGATKPEEEGYFYAWGETSPKDTYSNKNYKFFKRRFLTDVLLKYSSKDLNNRLDLIDDAASANWGGKWRMPTVDEMSELREKCKWEWTTQGSLQGYRVTSGTNGNSIFLPAAGSKVDSELLNGGKYWSSSLDPDIQKGAWAMSFNIYAVDVGGISWYRANGYSIRPVIEI